MNVRTFWTWVFALIISAGPPTIAAWVGPENLQQWIGVYIAGAFGGLVLELGATRGQLELPSARQRKEDADDEAVDERAIGTPLGAQVDLGFFSRMFLGGLAAFAVLLIAKFLASGAKTQDFPTSANSVATYAWAVAIGFTSPAAWAAVKRVAEARYESALAVADARDKAQKKHVRKARAKVDQAKEIIRRAADHPAQERAMHSQRLSFALQRYVDDPSVKFTADDQAKISELAEPPPDSEALASEAMSHLDEAGAILETLLD
jgi:hypothetical protein